MDDTDRKSWEGNDEPSLDAQKSRLRADGDMTGPADRAPYFVLAHHRSGSNFLNDLLQSHPCLECFNEPLSMHTGFFLRCDLTAWTGEQYHHHELHPHLAPFRGLREYLTELREYLLHSTCDRVIGFKDTLLFEKLQWLKAFIPSLKVILLRRDPRGIVSSVLRSRLIDFWNYSHLVPPAFRALFPHYVSRVKKGDDEASAAEIVAMSVVTRYALAARDLNLFDHRVVHLEELLRRPHDHLDMLAHFLGVPPHDAPLHFIEDHLRAQRGGRFSSHRRQQAVIDGWHAHLSASQVAVIEEVMQCT